MQFAKYHGLGNDFILLDFRDGAPAIDAARARELCDRHTGIGADGVLSLFASGHADARLHIFNADGSEPESCGNGIRCAALALTPRAADGGPGSATVRLATPAGLVECRVEKSDVEVDMGRATFHGADVPLDAGGRVFQATLVSMGNPHAVIFQEGAADRETLCREYGPRLEVHPRFPARTNVEFATVVDGAIDVAVWERGAGFTQACGTGACATAVAAAVKGLVPRDEAIEVRLPGGSLRITVGAGDHVRMRGPAVKAYEGNVCGRKLGREQAEHAV